jgi:Ala-tRNA(Pro) deacylase
LDFFTPKIGIKEFAMPAKMLKEFLDDNNIKYVSITHSTAYTTQEIASLAHVKGREMAKTVVVLIDDMLAMAVLPASYHVDLQALRTFIGCQIVSLATEPQFRDKFPGCETGAMPPFGNLYGMPVYVDESLMRDKEIVFNAGTHNELIRMAYQDFARLVEPTVARFAALRTTAAAAP